MKIKKIIAILCIATLVLSNVAYASGLGVATHIGGYSDKWSAQKTGEVLNELSGTWVRDEIRWEFVEKTKGNLVMPSDVAFVDKALESGANPLLILTYGNPCYETGEFNKPLPVKSMTEYYEAWLNYVRFIASNLKGKVKAYEVWNEPDHEGFNPNATAEEYAQLYLDTRAEIKKIDPNVTVLCGALCGTENWEEDIVTYIKNNGGLSQIDAFSVHVYNHLGEGKYGFRDAIDARWEKINDLGYNGDFWVTETGWYTSGESPVSEEEQASLVAKFPLIFDKFKKDNGVNGEIIWYCMKDTYAPDAEGKNYGLQDYYYNNKMSFKTAKLVNKLLKDMNIESLTSYSSEVTKYTAKYNNTDGDVVYVIWSTKNGGENVSVNLTGAKTYVYGLNGALEETLTSTGSKSFFVNSYPTFIYSTNERIIIENVHYDASKNAAYVFGRINDVTKFGKQTVTVELLNGSSESLLSVDTKVDADGKFKEWLSVPSDGAFGVKASYDSLSTTKTGFNAVKKIDAENNPSVTATTSYNGTTKKLTISGTVTDCDGADELTILVVPTSITPENANPEEIAYIGQVTVNNEAFSKDIILPDGFAGNYSAYVNINNSNTVSNSSSDTEAMSGMIFVSSFNASISEDTLTATATLKNINDSANKAVILIAQYGANGQIISLTKKDAEMSALTYGATTYTTSVAKAYGAVSAKAFLWNDELNFKPLSNSIVIFN